MRWCLIAALLVCAGISHGASVRGLVVDQTGAVIVGVDVLVAGSVRSERLLSEIRGFALRGLEPGEYRTLLFQPGFKPRQVRFRLSEGQDLDLGELQLQVLAFASFDGDPVFDSLGEQNAGEISGTVRDETGRTLTNARVELRCGEVALCGATSRNGRGEFRFAAIPAGFYRFHVKAAGYYPLDLSVEAVAGFLSRLQTVVLERCAESTCDPNKRRLGIILE